MSDTEERKRRAIEHFYISDRSPSYGDGGIENLRKNSAVLLKERYKIYKTMKYKERLGSNKKFCGVTCAWTVESSLCLSVGKCQAKLDTARDKAKDALKFYLEDKKRLKDGTTSWLNANVRDIYHLHKREWIRYSNEVVERKHDLWQAQLRYQKFLEWYNSTNKYIAYLEKEVSKGD